MLGIIDGFNFKEMAPQKYWAPPSSWSEEKKKETTRNRVFSGEWYGSEKKDGYFAKLVKDEDGNVMLLSRSRNVNGEYPDKHEWVPHLQPFFDWLPNGTCLLGELYLPSKPGSSNITTLLGCLKEKCIARQEAGEKLHFYVFDVLAYNGKSFMKKTMRERIHDIDGIFGGFLLYNCDPKKTLSCEDCVEFAAYHSGKILWAQLQTILANGGEGMVIVRGEALYQPDKRPSKDCQKVKKELADNIDCFFTGRATAPTRLYTGKEIETWKYWVRLRDNQKLEGEFYEDYKNGVAIEPVTKSYFMGLAGSLEIAVMKDGVETQIGFLSGLSDEIKADAWAMRHKCIEVAAMEVYPDSRGLRHGKFKCFRPDLTPADCTWNKIFSDN